MFDIFPILVVIAIFIVVTWVLIALNRKIHEKIESEKNKFLPFKKKLKKLKPNNESLEALNKLAKDFFKERFNMVYSLTYLDLAENFKKKKQEDIVEFCNLMTHLTYSGKKSVLEIKKAMNLFSDILNKYS